MIFVLVLNPMRGRIEEAREVARAESEEELLAFLEAERLPEPTSDAEEGGYRDGHTWVRSFRPGPLHWFNDLHDKTGAVNDLGHGIHKLISREEVAQQAVLDYDRFVNGIPTVASLRS